MPANSEIRTVNFAQGINVTTSTVLDESGKKVIINNSANQSTGLTYNSLSYREVIIEYSIRRRTDATALAGDVIIEGGTLKLTSNPDAALLANKWIKKHTTREDEGVVPGVTFAIVVTSDGAGNSIVDLQYTSTNLAGANHDCVMSYSTTSFLI